MRCLERNKRDFYYALYDSIVEVVDEYGNPTGEGDVRYKKPLHCRANISAEIGETAMRQFGKDLEYDRVITMSKQEAPPIDEYTVLWIDTVPSLDVNGELEKDESGNVLTQYDYVVKKSAESLNQIVYAISKVNVR